MHLHSYSFALNRVHVQPFALRSQPVVEQCPRCVEFNISIDPADLDNINEQRAS